MYEVWPGRPSPLGATWDGEGVNFALYSENAKSVDLCLFDSPEAAAPRCSRLAAPAAHLARLSSRVLTWAALWLPRVRPL
jgi:pullulanase/glycogen debranching enzyme